MITINGKTYIGNDLSFSNNNIIIDDKVVNDLGDSLNVTIHVDGNINSIDGNASVITVTGNVGCIENGSGNITVTNSVSGDIKTGSGNVRCGDVSGSIKTGSGNVYRN